MKLGLRALDQSITLDPIVIDGQVVGQSDPVTGTAPPTTAMKWLPWIIAGGALALAWWLSEQGEGRNDRPLVRA